MLQQLTTIQLWLLLAFVLSSIQQINSFGVTNIAVKKYCHGGVLRHSSSSTTQQRPVATTAFTSATTTIRLESRLNSSPSPADEDEDTSTKNMDEKKQKLQKEEDERLIGNLVAQDEWDGLGMELPDLIVTAIKEDLKKNARDFLGKDDYKIGDISKEVDLRVKTEVANMRNKPEYELGDLTLAIDETAKSMTAELTGKPYEFGDLSKEIDSSIKTSVAKYCGKDEYEFGVSRKGERERERAREIS